MLVVQTVQDDRVKDFDHFELGDWRLASGEGISATPISFMV